MNLRRVINLGAGTQSSVVYLWACAGETEPAEVAIFADTQWEPRAVYEHLEWLEREGAGRVPIVRVSVGNLREDAIEFRQNRKSADGKRFASMPLYVLNPDTSDGMIRRQCTSEYKIDPINKWIRSNVLGLRYRQHAPREPVVAQVFGISFDERQRMRTSTEPWNVFEYPLIDRKLTRQRVIDLARERWPDHSFPRSACIGCPYHSNEEWRDMRDNRPQEWTDAVAFDKAIRVADQQGQVKRGVLVGAPFLHRDRVPLDEVDLRSDDERTGQINLFGTLNECTGMCGV